MQSLLGCFALTCALLIHPRIAHALPPEQGSPSTTLGGASPYNPQNPFARIIRGELPALKVYEDKQVLAFLSLDQAAPGHVLVISKTSRAQNIFEMAPRDLARVMRVVQRVAKAEVKALQADGVVIQQNNGAAGNQSVFHLHVHVVPHWAGSPPAFPRDADGKLDSTVLAARIAAAMVR
ncbi:MAG: HIT family protein [Dokdonella sp.]